MGDFNAPVGKQANPTETATATFEQHMKIEGGDIFVKWTTSRQYKTISEESRELMDVDRPKRCNEVRN